LLDSLLQEMVSEIKMNQEKLKQLQAQVRIGGKGTVRRKKKVVHRTATTDDKKLQSSLKKLSVNNIPGIEEVNMIKDDGTVIHFNNPKVQASLAANTFAVTGHAENKQITEMLPGILNQLGAESLTHLKRLASNVSGGQGMGGMEGAGGTMDEEEDDEVPDLVENFDEVSKNETATEDAKISEVIDEVPAAKEEAVTEAKISEVTETEPPTPAEPVKVEAALPEPVEAALTEPVEAAPPVVETAPAEPVKVEAAPTEPTPTESVEAAAPAVETAPAEPVKVEAAPADPVKAEE